MSDAEKIDIRETRVVQRTDDGEGRVRMARLGDWPDEVETNTGDPDIDVSDDD